MLTDTVSFRQGFEIAAQHLEALRQELDLLPDRQGTPQPALEGLAETLQALERAHDDLARQKQACAARCQDLEAELAHFRDLFENDANARLLAERMQVDEGRERYLAQATRDRQRAEELAATSQRERDTLKAVMESTRAQMAYLDPHFNFVLVNTAYAEGSGHAKEELVGRNHFDLFPDPENQGIFDTVRATGQPVMYQAKPFEYPDQPERGIAYWDWSLAPVKNSAAQVEGLVLSLSDVTRQVRDGQHLESLRAQAQRQAAEMEAVFAALVDPAIVYDTAGAIVRANPAAVESLGLDPVGLPMAVLGQKVRVCYPDRRPIPVDELVAARALRGKTVRNESELMVRAHGDERAIMTSAAPIVSGGYISGAVAVWHDVTDLRRAEAALRQVKERLEFTQAASGAGSWDWDIPSGKLEWSPKMFDLFGLDMRTTAASFDAWRSVLHPEDKEAAERRINLAVETYSDLASEYRIIQPNGRLRWISALGKVLYDEKGRPARMSGLCLDITDRKLAEAKVEHLSSFPQLNPNPVLEIDACGAIVFHNAATIEAIRRLRLEDGPSAFLPDDLAVILQELNQKKESAFQREVQVGSATFSETVQVTPAFGVVRIYAFEITQGKQAEEALRKSEETALNLIKYAPVAIYELDISGTRFIGVNDIACEWTGYTKEELLAMRPRDLLEDESRIRFQERIRSKLSGQSIDESVVYNIVAKDGHKIVAELNVGAFSYKDNKPESVLVVGHNITERQRMDQALREGEEKLSALFRILPIGLSILDQERHLRMQNPALARILGLHEDDLQRGAHEGRRYLRADGTNMPPEELPSVCAFEDQQEVRDVEIGVIKEDGEQVWTSVSAVPLPFPDWRVAVATVDITKRKRAEEALRRERDFSNAVLDTSGALVVVLDREGRIVRFNRACEQITGYIFDEVKGQPLGDLVLLPEEVESVRASFAELQDGHFRSEHENRWRTRDGSLRWIRWSNTMLRGDDGAVEYYIAIGIDITEHREMEEALRSAQLQVEAEKRDLEAVFQALPVGVIITDAQGGVLLTNGMDAQIWGTRPITHDVDDYAQYKAWWADSREPVEPHEWASAQAVEKGESVFGQVLEIQRFDGGRRSVLNSAVPIHDSEGRVTGSAVAIQDITELRRAERALRESEERFRTVVENSRDGINMLDLETGRYLFMSPAQVKLTGFSTEEMNNLPVEEAYDRVHPDDREKSVSQLREIAEGRDQGSTIEYRWKVRTGEYRWFSDSRTLVRDEQGRPVALVGVSRDITDRKQAEEALRASEEKFANMFRVSPTGLVIARTHGGTVLDVNEALASALGYERSELIGVKVGDANLIPTIDARRRLARLVREGEPVVEHELDFRKKNGEIATMVVSFAPIQVDDEACVLAAARDITIRKRVEEALRRTEAELAVFSRERAVTEERQRLARELHDSVSQALYGISLGVNTAMTLLDVDRSKVVEALDYSLSQTQAGLAEMRALIFALRPEALATEGVVAALRKETAALIARRSIEIELTVCDEPDVSLEVKEALYRIAQEALQNAVKHARADRLEVRLSCEPASLGLEVCDNGIGFDPLVDYPGHLGLRSMRERAMSIGGTLDIVSAPNCGTQIRVQVPIPPSELASSP